MEPMLPQEGSRKLDDLTIELVAKASSFGGKLNPVVRATIGDLVRNMNCYYSNLIEGHNTTPREIDRALADKYSDEPKKRALQKEAVAHITVQKMIDRGSASSHYPISASYGKWLHREFCELLPEELLKIQNPDTGEEKKIIPGEYRDGSVAVGSHIPPEHKELEHFLNRFDEAYAPERLSKPQRIVAIAASHHRYLWIHPFYDGNGRVVRLMSYSALKELGIGSELWSVARGLARRNDDYKRFLSAADEPRRGDLDGRGSLSHQALIAFCEFFLSVCIDQVEYMDSLLDFQNLSERIRIFIDEMVALKKLPNGSYSLLREALLVGEFERGKVAQITGMGDRGAREALYSLLKMKLLISDTPRGPVRLAFPLDVIERWLPRLYPVA